MANFFTRSARAESPCLPSRSGSAKSSAGSLCYSFAPSRNPPLPARIELLEGHGADSPIVRPFPYVLSQLYTSHFASAAQAENVCRNGSGSRLGFCFSLHARRGRGGPAGDRLGARATPRTVPLREPTRFIPGIKERRVPWKCPNPETRSLPY